VTWRDDLSRVRFPAGTGGSSEARSLIGATYRGGSTAAAVPFFVTSSEHTTGRRGATHEYAFRDEPYREDLGRATRTFAVEGYVIGPDYIAARDALLAALEQPGVGELRHPYYGVRSVAVEGVRVRETSTDGGMAVFSVDFVETPAQPAWPSSTPDPVSALRSNIAGVRVAIAAAFTATYAPSTWQESLAGALRSASGALASGLAFAALTGESAARAHRLVTGMSNNAAALVSSPATVLETIVEVFNYFPVGAWRGVLTVYGFNAGPRPAATTPAREAEQASFDALQRLVQRSALVRAAELVVDDSFMNYEAAIAARDYFVSLLDDQSTVAADDTYPALMQLRADVVRALPGEQSSLPRLGSHTPLQTIPSLVLAYELYGSLELEQDLLIRNRVRHPAFVPGGEPLEVLSRG
jgi:prophage DNA circulation protein